MRLMLVNPTLDEDNVNQKKFKKLNNIQKIKEICFKIVSIY